MKILTVDQIITLMKLKNIKELGSVSFSSKHDILFDIAYAFSHNVLQVHVWSENLARI